MLRDLLWIFRLEVRVSRRDFSIFVVLFVMPFVVLYLVAPAMRPALQAMGYADATGAEQAMPGIAVLFSNFAMAFLAFAIFREHTWRTYERLLVAPLSPLAILGGKALLPFLLVIAQQLVLFGAAHLVFGVQMRGEWSAYVALSVALAAFAVAAGLALSAWLASLQQINSFVNIGTFVLAGVGGAFAPVHYLPPWIQSIAIFSPNYWAIDGFKAVLLQAATFQDVLPGVIVLLAGATLCSFVALAGFASPRRREKRAWA